MSPGLHSRACFAHPLCPGYPWIRVSPRVSLALLSLFRIIIFKCPKVTLAPDICILLHRKYYWVYFTCMCKRVSPGSHWPWQGGKCSQKPPQCYFPWQPHHGYQALAQQEERNTADYLTHRWAWDTCSHLNKKVNGLVCMTHSAVEGFHWTPI